MKYDLFISDFDWTLGIAPDKIEEESVKAIKEYIKKGGKFVVVSGRMIGSVRNICLKYGLTGLCVGFQGAVVADIESGELIFDGGIDKKTAIEAINLFKSTGESTTLNAGQDLYYEKSSKYIEIYENATGKKGIVVDNLPEFAQNYNGVIHKVNAIADDKVVKVLTPKLQKALEGKLVVNNGASYMIEAINPNYSKNFAVKFLADYYKIPYEKVITVGDSTNDIGLITGEWHGVAVGDAMQGLKDVADEITVDFKDQPIKYLLEKYC